MDYFVHSAYLTKRIKIAVIGVGGTGGEIIDALTRLDFGMKALGHPEGIHVTAFDADKVEAHNIGRQRFSQADIGAYKSLALINRTNMFYGLDWDAEPRFFDIEKDEVDAFDIIIGCVDKAKFRVELGKLAAESYERGERRSAPVLWLDLGNGEHTGQAVLGHLYQAYREELRLPTIFDLYPSLEDGKFDEDESTPRCSLAEALQSQDLYINSALATMSMNLLWELFTKGKLEHHGVMVDTHSLKCYPLMIDEEGWSFYGYKPIQSEVA